MFIKELKGASPAVGPYSAGVKLGDFVYISGQLPTDAEGNLPEGIEAQTHQSIKNLMTVLGSANLELRHVVKTTVFLQDMNDFAKFNAIYASYFTAPYPARSCVQVAALPKGALVEIEALVIDTLAYESQCSGNCSGCAGC